MVFPSHSWYQTCLSYKFSNFLINPTFHIETILEQWLFPMKTHKYCFLAVHNSSIGDLVTHSLTHSLTQWATFVFWHYRGTQETSDLWDIWSQWWGNMTWLTFWQFLTNFTNFDNFWQFWKFFLTIFDNLTIWQFWQFLTIFNNFWQFDNLTICVNFDNFRQFWQFWQFWTIFDNFFDNL